MKVTLKAARVNAGMTQTELGLKIGVSKQTVIAWETGQRAVKPAYLPAIAQVTGCSVNDIILPKVITNSN